MIREPMGLAIVVLNLILRVLTGKRDHYDFAE